MTKSKSIIRITSLVILIICLSLFFAGCDNKNNEKDANSQTIYAYLAEPTGNLSVANVCYSDSFYAFYFNLGTVRKTPVYTSTAMQFNGEQYSVSLSFDSCTEESLEESISKSTETVDTHSYTGGFEIGFEESVQAKVDFIVAGSKINLASKQSTDHHWTNDWGTTVTNSQSNTKSYTTAYSEGYSYEVNFSENNGFEKGRFYRFSFYETTTIYGVLYFDIETEKFTVAYETFLNSKEKQVVLEKSNEQGVFQYNINHSIDFDVDEARELALDELERLENDGTINLELGTLAHPYKISNADDMSKIGVYDDENVYFALTKDIDLSGIERWTPIENLKGVLDGKGHTITGLTWSRNTSTISDDMYVGLFSIINKTAIVKNLNFTSASFSMNSNDNGVGYLYVGAIAGQNFGTITHCNVASSSINIHRRKSGYGFITGVVRDGGQVTFCDVSSFVCYGNGHQGGIAAILMDESSKIANCTVGAYDTSVVSQMNHWSVDCRFIGGIVGYCSGSYIVDCSLQNVSFSLKGKADGGIPIMGYLVGYASDSTLKNLTASNVSKSGQAEEDFFSVGWGYAGKSESTTVVNVKKI